MNGSLCDDFIPTSAGENFASLVKITKPTVEAPLILLLEEGDGTFKKIHENTIKSHEFLNIPVFDKASHNMFMDRLSQYDNVFVIITMNSTFNEIDSLDPSYCRYGRVDLKINFGGDDSYNTDKVLHIKPFSNISDSVHDLRFATHDIEMGTIMNSDDKKIV